MALMSDRCVTHHNVKEQGAQPSCQGGRSVNVDIFSGLYRDYEVIPKALQLATTIN